VFLASHRVARFSLSASRLVRAFRFYIQHKRCFFFQILYQYNPFRFLFRGTATLVDFVGEQESETLATHWFHQPAVGLIPIVVQQKTDTRVAESFCCCPPCLPSERPRVVFGITIVSCTVYYCEFWRPSARRVLALSPKSTGS
jgi:hypothetical protein